MNSIVGMASGRPKRIGNYDVTPASHQVCWFEIKDALRRHDTANEGACFGKHRILGGKFIRWTKRVGWVIQPDQRLWVGIKRAQALHYCDENLLSSNVEP
jgi:hypothetical protein